MFGVFHVGTFVPDASERVNIVYAWLQQVLQERLKDNGLTLAAPVGSRMWQILSEGYAQFEQCRWLSTYSVFLLSLSIKHHSLSQQPCLRETFTVFAAGSCTSLAVLGILGDQVMHVMSA